MRELRERERERSLQARPCVLMAISAKHGAHGLVFFFVLLLSLLRVRGMICLACLSE